MKHLTEMKPGETLHLRSGRDLELESVTPVTCGVMLTFNVTERKMIQSNTVITGDSLTVLRDMEADSVDMVITDPPYGIDYQSGRKEKASRLAKIANDKAPFIWWIYDAARVVKRGGGYSVLPAGTFSRYSSTRCVSLA